MIAVAAELRPVKVQVDLLLNREGSAARTGSPLMRSPCPTSRIWVGQRQASRQTGFEDWVSVAWTSSLRRIRELRRPIQPRSETYGSGATRTRCYAGRDFQPLLLRARLRSGPFPGLAFRDLVMNS